MAADLYLYANPPKGPTDIVLRTSAAVVEVQPPGGSGRPIRWRAEPVPPPDRRRVQVFYGPAIITGETVVPVQCVADTGPARVFAWVAVTPTCHATTRALISAEHRTRIATRASLPDDLDLLLLAAAAWDWT